MPVQPPAPLAEFTGFASPALFTWGATGKASARPLKCVQFASSTEFMSHI